MKFLTKLKNLIDPPKEVADMDPETKVFHEVERPEFCPKVDPKCPSIYCRLDRRHWGKCRGIVGNAPRRRWVEFDGALPLPNLPDIGSSIEKP
jgi:hypothetical protein